jgi:hypothetical protein
MNTTTEDTPEHSHTPGPWDYDMDYIVAPDPNGIYPDIYIAEIAHTDSEGRIASSEQQDANRRLIAAAPCLLKALRSILAAGPYGSTDQYRAAVDKAHAVIAKAEEGLS